jgi:hypothetical protein
MVFCEDAIVAKIALVENLTDPFTKALPHKTFEYLLVGMCQMYAKLNLRANGILLGFIP